MSEYEQNVKLATLGLSGSVEAVLIQDAEPDALLRKPVYLALQQLGSVDRAKKLGHLPLDIDEYELVDDPSGIVLSYAAGRLLHGILALFEATGRGEGGGYLGHFVSYEEELRRDAAGRETINRLAIPGLYISEPELLEAYGLNKHDDGRYGSKQREIVLAALDELDTAKQQIYYERRPDAEPGKRGRKSGKRPTVRITAPLLKVTQIEYFDDISMARAGGDPRANWYKVEPMSLVVDRLATFHFRSYVALYPLIDDTLAELRGTRRGRKGSYHALFIDYLQTASTATLSIEIHNLATKIRLGYMAKNRRTGDMERAVLEAAEVAYRLGFLLEPMQIAVNSAGRSICYMRLNPAKCTRVKTLE